MLVLFSLDEKRTKKIKGRLMLPRTRQPATPPPRQAARHQTMEPNIKNPWPDLLFMTLTKSQYTLN